MRPGQAILEFLSWPTCLMSISTSHPPNLGSKLMVEPELERPGWRHRCVCVAGMCSHSWIGAKGDAPGQEAGWPKCQAKADGQASCPPCSWSFLDVDILGENAQETQDQSLNTTLGC